MIAIIVVLCLYTLLLLVITLATIAYVLHEFTTQLLEHTLHPRDHPSKHDTWG